MTTFYQFVGDQWEKGYGQPFFVDGKVYTATTVVPGGGKRTIGWFAKHYPEDFKPV
jgi:hypothetical protein